ncbi:CBS domain-containing protein [Nitrosopumilus sp. Nsub]|uniref:CBS domain-containing protein n=1 Tax=Nitrosopumilus sp. Nsub TaxID=1776294 RepID=UPI000833C5A4|nr:CBS domain-containing protein [Nitrosopumilus sp. Nsub]
MKMIANDIMNENVVFTEKTNWIQEVAEKMNTLNVSYVIIVDKTKPIGIVTEKDFAAKIISKGQPLFTEIHEIMSSPLITVSPEKTIHDIIEIMKKREIHKLPVQKNGKIIGMITAIDIVKNSSSG